MHYISGHGKSGGYALYFRTEVVVLFRNEEQAKMLVQTKMQPRLLKQEEHIHTEKQILSSV